MQDVREAVAMELGRGLRRVLKLVGWWKLLRRCSQREQRRLVVVVVVVVFRRLLHRNLGGLPRIVG